MNEPSADQVRDMLKASMAEARPPLPWSDVEQRAAAPTATPREPRRWAPWLGAAAGIVGLVAGLLVLGTRTDDREPSVATEASANPTVATSRPEGATAPSEPSVTLAPTAAASLPPDLSRPVSGQTQRTVIGDINWTLLTGDETTLPQSVQAVIDGAFYSREGETTWRSADGVVWEQVDQEPNGILGVFEIDGETWARRSTLGGQGLGRWNGEVFEPVELPPSTAPVIDGLRSTPAFTSDPVAFGDEWAVPVATRIEIPWDEFYSTPVYTEWDPVVEELRVFDMESNEPVATLSATVVDAGAPVVEFRDVGSGEVVVGVEVPTDVDPATFRRTLVERGGFTHHELLIGDGDGFRAAALPRDIADRTDIATLGDELIATVVHTDAPAGQDAPAGSPVHEVWSSSDGLTWQPVVLPTPTGSRIDATSVESDGSLALLSIVSGDENTQQAEWWWTTDAITWTPNDAISGFDARHTDVGWLQTDVYATGGIRVSSDGLTWQDIDFDIRPPAGPGGAGVQVYGDTIFVTEFEGGVRTMWVGRVVDPDE